MNDTPGSTTPRSNGAHTETATGSGLVTWVKRLFGVRTGGDALRDTLEELIEKETPESTTTDDERVLIRNILNIRDLTAYDVMVPRADIVAVPIEADLDELIKLMGGEAHSRLPVYRDTLDDVVGMVHIKDVLAALPNERPFRLADILRRVLFVAPSMPVLELLLQMRVGRTHLALVVDEFGGIDGLVTIENLVETIVGEIEDEHDDESAPTVTEHADGSLELDARVPIEDFEKRVGPVLTEEEREEDIDTMGGLVFFLADRVPGRGEVIRHASGIEFEVLDADPRRIKRLRARSLPPRPAPE
ncbi:MAG: HlyC/CorC family transporter [Alphaproteobacteria bacterium]|nr:HlyC/CorC family transporter [Alphaproteobacteria bacterium]